MQQHPSNRRHTPRPERVTAPIIVIIAAAAALLASCATPGADPGGTRLERLAQRQLNHPTTRTRSAEPPTGLRLEPIDAATDPEAFESLDSAVAHFSNEDLPLLWSDGVEAPLDDTITEEDETNALRRYIAGRSELVGGDLAGAIRHLDAASTLDPNAPEIWRTLADAHWSSGDRLAATAAYLRAIKLDPDDTVSLMRVGLTEMERRSHFTAAILLARAHQSIASGEHEDAAIPYIVDVALGRTLHELGWTNAGNEAIVGALGGLTTFAQPTSYRHELGAMIRSAGDAWRDVGDAAVRLGRPDEALEAYRRAAELPSFDPAALLTRRVYADMLLGRPAAAAVLLVNRIGELHGLVDDRTLQLIRYLTSSSEVGPALAAAIDQIKAGLTPDELRIAASQLTRARAAASDDQSAVRILIDRLIAAPSDESAVSDLLNRRSPDDAPGLVEMVSRLIEANTIESQRYADALMRYSPDNAALFEAVESRGGETVGDLLLGAALTYDLGDADRAGSLLERARSLSPGDPGVRLAQAALAIKSGQPARARALLASIDIAQSQSAALAVARAYRELGENKRAMSILEDRVWNGDATAEEAQVAGETSVALGAPLDAEQLFKLAIELDPSLEEAHAGLIALYQSTGPLANQANLADALRSLRAAIPSSRTLRWLRVQDLLRVDRLDQAQRELLSLAEESLDPVVIEQLISVWIRTGAAETAQQWLTDQIERHPNLPDLTRLLARVQASRKNTDGAIKTLEAWLDRHPADAGASRELENILRLESVNRPDEADAIALKRLSQSPPSVRRSIEIAPILIRQGRAAEAIGALGEPMDDDLPIDPAVVPGYGQLIAGAATYAVKNQSDDPETATASIALLRRFLLRFPDSSLAMHRTLIALLIQSDAPAEQIGQAAVDAGRAHPQATDDIVLEAIQRLIQEGKLAVAHQIATDAVHTMQAPSPRLLAMWLALARDQLDADVTTEALELIERNQQGVETVAAINSLLNNSIPDVGADENRALAELAYYAAVGFAGTAQDSVSDRLYEFALEHNPRHAMANNNLAYSWVESDINLERAHDMLKIAYEENPSSDAIADSLGWVRYKLGMIDDQRDEQGRIVLQGAVSMLSAAAKLSGPNPSPEILDHLADAQWRFGQTDRAIALWRQSRTILRKLADIPNRIEPQSELITTLLSQVERKLDAVADGKVPPLAPMLRPRRWTQETINNDKNNTRNATQGAPL